MHGTPCSSKDGDTQLFTIVTTGFNPFRQETCRIATSGGFGCRPLSATASSTANPRQYQVTRCARCRQTSSLPPIGHLPSAKYGPPTTVAAHAVTKTKIVAYHAPCSLCRAYIQSRWELAAVKRTASQSGNRPVCRYTPQLNPCRATATATTALHTRRGRVRRSRVAATHTIH